MLGRDLASVLEARHEVAALDRSACDITREDSLPSALDRCRPAVVINCAAYADVDGCELDPERAFAVNAQGAGHVARAAEAAGARLFHISTDYVFDGAKGAPYCEQDAVNPLNVYGQSKLQGERLVLAETDVVPRHLVIRTSWLYGLHGANFIETMLAAAQSRRELAVVADQIGSPTWTVHLAQWIQGLLETSAAGVMHVSGSGQCSRYEFAEAIFEQAAAQDLCPRVTLRPATSEQFPRPARRPPYSVLECRRLQQLGLGTLPHWKQGLEEYFALRQKLASPRPA